MSKDSTPSGHPPLGTLIDESSLKLVEVLGTGGYGVVYRAIDAYSRSPRSYAVKCLAYSDDRSAARRHLHMREVALHQLASSHSSVVTLHRVVREHNCLFLVMEYATDGDLFAQILNETTYLGRDDLIKKVFLQIINAVQHCHYLGIYHRDLKPENVLCFDRGYRVAITDFGLATTDKTSKEFRTGSVYHMSPECQSADSKSSSATYSPQHNDIWSLGIMLLNLTTGRNPWKSATPDDPTFQAYKRHPRRFLKQVLPISEELNDILEGALAVDWRKRMTLSEMATAIQRVRTFYSDNVVFDGNLATCPWEAGFDINNDGREKSLPETPVDDIAQYYVVAPSRKTSQITMLEGLEEEEDEDEEPVEWDGVHSDYEHQGGAVFWDTPVHSTYGYDNDSDSGDSDPPITPTDFDHESSQACSVIDWIAHTPIDDCEDDERTYCEQEAGITFHPFHDDEDGNPYMASTAFRIPPPKSHATPNCTYQASDFKTTRRYSSPNTSVYSIALDSEYNEDGVAYPDSGTRSGAPRSRPIDIPRTKSKSHGFNPLRFFPRSSGTSWLNPKSPSSTTVRPTRAPPPVQVKDYETRPTQRGQHIQGGYYQTPYVQPRQSPATTGRSSRAVGQGQGQGQGHGHGHWLPHFFSSFAAN